MFAVLALAGAASAAFVNTTTVEATKYTTIPCPTPTTFTYGSSVYTVSKATTLTVEDCSCTNTPSVAAAPATSSAGPVLANGAAAGKVGAAAGVAAVAAYLL